MFEIIEAEINETQKRLQKLNDLRHWAECREQAFEGLPEFSVYGHGIDFDCLPHEDVMKVVKAFPGKWKKELSTLSDPPKIDYEIIDEGVRIRCYQGEPPPSCKIVKEVIQVPEQIIPAHEKEISKLVCHE